MSAIASGLPHFKIITGKQTSAVIEQNRNEIISVVEGTYKRHFAGKTVNPDSYFLRFPDSAANRIIALPAHIEGSGDPASAVTGIKWISSFPGNIASGLPRASAVLILNDPTTGYPIACMEASAISAARTAASAASMAKLYFSQEKNKPVRISVIGAGLINRYVLNFLRTAGIVPEGVHVFDLQRQYADDFVTNISDGFFEVSSSKTIEECIEYGELILFATTAGSPHVQEKSLFRHNPLVLHLSLRDLSPEIITSAFNVVDDVEHCVKAQTSLHLAELKTGNRSFVHASIPELLSTPKSIERDSPVIFSPFGMGILDLAVGQYVLEELGTEAAVVNDFYIS